MRRRQWELRAKLNEKSREAAEASLIAARGIFDPLFSFTGGYAFSKTVGFTQGYPFTAESNTWDLRTTVSGTAPTGTTWNMSTGIDRNFSTFSTNVSLVEESDLERAIASFDIPVQSGDDGAEEDE